MTLQRHHKLHEVFDNDHDIKNHKPGLLATYCRKYLGICCCRRQGPNNTAVHPIKESIKKQEEAKRANSRRRETRKNKIQNIDQTPIQNGILTAYDGYKVDERIDDRGE